MSRPSIVVSALGLGIAVLGAQQPAGVFTADQASSGRAVYQASCASCHMADLAGRNEAPQLAGNNFLNTWRERTTRDLFEFTQSTMPPTGANLSAEQYLAVTAYLLQANGAQPGSQPLTTTTAQTIAAVVGRAPAAGVAARDIPTTTAGDAPPAAG